MGYKDARDYRACREQLRDPLGPDGNRLYRLASFDVARDEIDDRLTCAAADDAVLLFDGDFLLRPDFERCFEILVLLKVPSEVAATRGAARDAGLLGGYEAAHELHVLRYQAAFDHYEAQCKPELQADLVVDDLEAEFEPGGAAGERRDPA